MLNAYLPSYSVLETCLLCYKHCLENILYHYVELAHLFIIQFTISKQLLIVAITQTIRSHKIINDFKRDATY